MEGFFVFCFVFGNEGTWNNEVIDEEEKTSFIK